MQIICPSCEGTKLVNGLPCSTCKSSGESVGKIDYKGVFGIVENRVELFADLSPTCRVAGCIDSVEYLALSDAAKDGVKIILSLGFVDMREGQYARTTLFAIFDEESDTRAALIVMFG